MLHKLKLPTLNINILKFLNHFLKYLEPLAITLDKFQNQKDISMGDLIPYLNNLVFKLLEKLKKSNSNFSDNYVEMIILNIKRRFVYIFNPDKSDNSYKKYLLATISNPKWKARWCDSEKRKELKKLLMEEIKANSLVFSTQNDVEINEVSTQNHN